MLLHYDKKQAKLEGNSIGILNVQKRIKLLCSPKYGLSYMENETGGVTHDYCCRMRRTQNEKTASAAGR